MNKKGIQVKYYLKGKGVYVVDSLPLNLKGYPLKLEISKPKCPWMFDDRVTHIVDGFINGVKRKPIFSGLIPIANSKYRFFGDIKDRGINTDMLLFIFSKDYSVLRLVYFKGGYQPNVKIREQFLKEFFKPFKRN